MASPSLLLSLPITSSTAAVAAAAAAFITATASPSNMNSATTDPSSDNEEIYDSAPPPLHDHDHLTPIVYTFTPSSFNLALSTAIVFFILSLLHTYLCFKKKTVFFAITIYASLAMTTSQTLKTYLVHLQTLLLSPPSWPSSPDPYLFEQFERAGVLTIVMELLEAVPLSAMGFLLMMTYTRLTWFLVPKSGRRNGRVLGLPVRWQTAVLAMGQVVGDGLAGVGQYYGIGFLGGLGGVVGVMSWGLLGGLVVRLGWRSQKEEGEREEKEKKGGKKLVWVVGGGVGLLIISGVSRIIRREQVSYLMYSPPWVLSDEEEQMMMLVSSEWPVYVFQHLPIVLILVLLAVYHPGAYLPRRLTGWRLNTKRLLREERMREDVESLKVLSRKDSKSSSSSAQGSELDCFERVDLDKETK